MANTDKHTHTHRRTHR